MSPSEGPLRQHTNRACDRCRRRKIKCDAQSPSCAKCKHLGLSCEYALPRGKRGPKFRSERLTVSPGRALSSLLASNTPIPSSPPIAASTCSPVASPAAPRQPPALASPDTLMRQAEDSVFQQPTTVPYGVEPLGYRRSAAHDAHGALHVVLASLGLAVEDVVRQCLELWVQWTFSIAAMYDPTALQRSISVLELSARAVFDVVSEITTPNLSNLRNVFHDDQAKLENLRSYTLLMAISAQVCAQAPSGTLDYGNTLAEPFLTASRQMLAVYEDYDVTYPDSSSLATRMCQSGTLHRLGQNRVSLYILGQAMRLVVDMGLSHEAAYVNLPVVEAHLRRNLYWFLYTSDKSASMLNGVASMLLESPPTACVEEGETGDDGQGEILLAEAFRPTLYTKTFERQLQRGIRIARRTWSLGSSIGSKIDLLSRSLGESGVPSEPSIYLDSFQQMVMQSYLTFCSLLDDLPAWLLRPAGYSDEEADDDVLAIRRDMFWVQRVDLVGTYYCLRLKLEQKAFSQGCPAILGLTNSRDMLALRTTELAQSLAAAIKDVPTTALQLNGEHLVEKFRQFGTALLEIRERITNPAICTRAKTLLTTFLDIIATVDSKATEHILEMSWHKSTWSGIGGTPGVAGDASSTASPAT